MYKLLEIYFPGGKLALSCCKNPKQAQHKPLEGGSSRVQVPVVVIAHKKVMASRKSHSLHVLNRLSVF